MIPDLGPARAEAWAHLHAVRLAALAALSTRHRVRAALEPYGLTDTTLAALLAVAVRPEGRAMGVVAAELPMTTGALTKVCDDLVAAGYLDREPQPDDRRIVLVRATQAGHDVLPDAVRWYLQAVST